MSTALKKKIQSAQGETLVETLISILLVALISAAFAAMIMAGSKVNDVTKENDEKLYKAVGFMEDIINNPESAGSMGDNIKVISTDATGKKSSLSVQAGTSAAPGNPPTFKYTAEVEVEFYQDTKMMQLFTYQKK